MKNAKADEIFELDDFDDDSHISVASSSVGALGDDVKPYLFALAENRRQGMTRDKMQSFIQWVKADDLETFLLLALDEAVKRTMS